MFKKLSKEMNYVIKNLNTKNSGEIFEIVNYIFKPILGIKNTSLFNALLLESKNKILKLNIVKTVSELENVTRMNCDEMLISLNLLREENLLKYEIKDNSIFIEILKLQNVDEILKNPKIKSKILELTNSDYINEMEFIFKSVDTKSYTDIEKINYITNAILDNDFKLSVVGSEGFGIFLKILEIYKVTLAELTEMILESIIPENDSPKVNFYILMKKINNHELSQNNVPQTSNCKESKINQIKSLSNIQYLFLLKNGFPSAREIEIVENLSFTSKLNSAVLNCLIEYCLSKNSEIARAYIEKIHSSLIIKDINDIDTAMAYFRNAYNGEKNVFVKKTNEVVYSKPKQTFHNDYNQLSLSEIFERAENNDK